MKPFLLDMECVGNVYKFTQIYRAYLTTTLVVIVLKVHRILNRVLINIGRPICISRGANICMNLVAAARETSKTLCKSRFSSLPEFFFQSNLFTCRWEDHLKNLDWVDYESEINVLLMLHPYPYTLRAVIYHSGPFGKGHYSAYVRYRGSNKWMLYNDNSVCVLNKPKAKKKPIDPKTLYLFVYSRLWCKSMPLTLILRKSCLFITSRYARGVPLSWSLAPMPCIGRQKVQRIVHKLDR